MVFELSFGDGVIKVVLWSFSFDNGDSDRGDGRWCWWWWWGGLIDFGFGLVRSVLLGFVVDEDWVVCVVLVDCMWVWSLIWLEYGNVGVVRIDLSFLREREIWSGVDCFGKEWEVCFLSCVGWLIKVCVGVFV